MKKHFYADLKNSSVTKPVVYSAMIASLLPTAAMAMNNELAENPSKIDYVIISKYNQDINQNIENNLKDYFQQADLLAEKRSNQDSATSKEVTKNLMATNVPKDNNPYQQETPDYTGIVTNAGCIVLDVAFPEAEAIKNLAFTTVGLGLRIFQGDGINGMKDYLCNIPSIAVRAVTGRLAVVTDIAMEKGAELLGVEDHAPQSSVLALKRSVFPERPNYNKVVQKIEQQFESAPSHPEKKMLAQAYINFAKH